MRTITETYNVYRYDELSDDAKEKVKQWYLDDDFRPYEFTEIYEQDLQNILPDSELKLQYSLNYCQGDGLNIYGELNINNILNLPTSHFCGDEFDDMIGYFTEKEIKTIQCYMREVGNEIKLPQNNHYCYCIVDRIDFVDDWFYELEDYSHFRNINRDVLEKLEKYVIIVMERLCSDYEKYGYDFFYNVDDEVIEETCEANEWEFLEDGTFYAA